MATKPIDLAQFQVGSNRKEFFITAPDAESAYALLAECKRLREENAMLRATLTENTRRAELLARSLRIDGRTLDGITKDQAADRLDHDAEQARAALKEVA